MVKLNVMDRKVLLWCVLGQWVTTPLRNSISMENSFSLVLPLTKSLGSSVEMTGSEERQSRILWKCVLHHCIPCWRWIGLFAVCFLFLIDLQNAALKSHFWSFSVLLIQGLFCLFILFYLFLLFWFCFFVFWFFFKHTEWEKHILDKDLIFELFISSKVGCLPITGCKVCKWQVCSLFLPPCCFCLINSAAVGY